MATSAPSRTTLLLRVFLPFAFAYFLSYIFRGVNAVIFPYLERDIGITAADLGLLTSAFFLFFALIQPIQGVALDRYGPRKVQTVLLLAAALGSALFGLCSSFAELVAARILIGIGFAGGLMAAIKIFTLWYPPRQWGLVTGFHMMAGGAGSMAATLPVQWSLSMMSWQGLFFWLAAICFATAVILFAVVPESPPTGRRDSLREQFRVTGIVLTDGFYWRLQPLMAVQQLAFIGCISLWIGPWLRDVGGIADTTVRAVVCGWLAFLPPIHPLLPWALFGFLGAGVIQYLPVMVAAFPPSYAGRVTTSSNFVVFLVIFAGQWAMGKVVDLWPRTATGYAPDGYTWAFGALFILQLASLAWLLVSRGRPMARGIPAAAD